MTELMKKAEALKPILNKRKIYPLSAVSIVKDDDKFQNLGVIKDNQRGIDSLTFQNGDSVILDFEQHCVGYLHLKISYMNRIADSPTVLKFTFGELPCEIITTEEEYHGGLGSGWIQTEIIKIPFLPHILTLDRRYAFRFLKIEMLGKHASFQVKIDDIYCMAESSADESKIIPLSSEFDPELKRIDEVSIHTLKECMQDVFEDGPKRDRRLWIGDLRLQAQANHYTFKNYDLVKRCIYLFAGNLLENDACAPYVFPNSPPYVDNWSFTDYSLFFISVLYDYYHATNDKDIVEELFPIVKKQIRVAKSYLNDKDMIDGNPFIDWCPGLERTVAMQGILIYTFKQALQLAELMNDATLRTELSADIHRLTKAALKNFDHTKGLFVSGDSKQVSWASQVWMVLADVLSKEENQKLLERLEQVNPEIKMHTPYMFHHYVEALFSNGKKEYAVEKIKEYWGGMLKYDIDCFLEVYNPDDEFESPYNDYVINSACHAWSCTPTYFMRKYLM